MAKELEKLTVPKLKEKAKDAGIEGYRIMKKDELVKALQELDVQEDSKKEVKEESKPKETPVKKRKLDNDDEIEIMNNTTGRYGYKGRSGFAVEMTDYGDITEIPFGELKQMRNNQKRHIEEAFIIILDEDAVRELRYEKLYENIFDQDAVEELLKDPVKLAEVLPKMPKIMKETVGSTAIRRLKSREIYDTRVKDAVEKALDIVIDV